MPVSFNVELDKSDIKTLERALKHVRNGVPRALSAAVNRTITTGRKRVADAVAEELTLKKSSINRRISKGPRATVARPTSYIRLKRESDGGKLKSPQLTSFRGVRDTRTARSKTERGTGVLVQTRRGGGRDRIKHGFIITGNGGVQIVATRAKDRRKTGYDKTRNRRRVALVAMRGPSVLGVFDNKPGLAERAMSDIRQVLDKNIRSQIDRFTK